MANITIINVTSTAIFLALEFGFSGNGILTEVSVVYISPSNSEGETVIFPEDGNGPVPSEIDITGLDPFTNYQFVVAVANEAGSSPSTNVTATTLPLRECCFHSKRYGIILFTVILLYLAPAVPTNVTATPGELGSVLTVSWIVSTYIFLYIVEHIVNLFRIVV